MAIQEIGRIYPLEDIHEKRDDSSPPGLVARSKPPSGVAVEILVEQDVLTPVRIGQADAVRGKLEALGITEQDVNDAVQWARRPA